MILTSNYPLNKFEVGHTFIDAKTTEYIEEDKRKYAQCVFGGGRDIYMTKDLYPEYKSSYIQNCIIIRQISSQRAKHLKTFHKRYTVDQ